MRRAGFFSGLFLLLAGFAWGCVERPDARLDLNAELELDAELEQGHADLGLGDVAVDADLALASGSPDAAERGSVRLPPRFALEGVPAPTATMLYKPSKSATRRGSAKLLGLPAPELVVDLWVPGDRPPPTVADNFGRVVVIYAFQGWCPGCQSRGFPVMRKIDERFAVEPVELVYVQTTFEGFEANDYDRAVNEQQQWRVRRPVGRDVAAGGAGRPSTMLSYRTGGTPWMVVIDPWGRVRFNDFTRDEAFHVDFVTSLLAEAAAVAPAPAQ